MHYYLVISNQCSCNALLRCYLVTYFNGKCNLNNYLKVLLEVFQTALRRCLVCDFLLVVFLGVVSFDMLQLK